MLRMITSVPMMMNARARSQLADLVVRVRASKNVPARSRRIPEMSAAVFILPQKREASCTNY